MATNKDKFFEMVNRVDFARRYWDEKGENILLEKVENDLGVLSSGEVAALKFLAGVWLGKNSLGFDFIDDFSSLDRRFLDVYKQWVMEPFFP